MTEIRMKDVMRREILTLTPETPMRRAAALMVEQRTAAAPVVGDDSSLAGILTQKDCFRPALHASYYREWKGRVADHMTREVVSVDVDDDLIHVAELFQGSRHRAFPVCSGTRLVGLVHRSDVLAQLLRLG